MYGNQRVGRASNRESVTSGDYLWGVDVVARYGHFF